MKRILSLLSLAFFPLAVYIAWTGMNPLLSPFPPTPFQAIRLDEQLAQAIAGLIIKPAYMLISLALIVLLFTRRAPDLRALAWGQVAFLTGETFCAINFYIYRHESALSEYLHSYGMVLAFAFTMYALLDGLDARLLRLTESRGACAALPLCGSCSRNLPSGCKARSLALWLLPLLAVLPFLPLSAPLQPDAYAVSVFGFPYSYIRLDFYEAYERRILPVFALLCLVAAWIPLLRKGEPPIPPFTKILFSAGLGALGFSFFRMTLSGIFAGNLIWFEFWEEVTELMFVVMLGLLLWQFRERLLGVTRLPLPNASRGAGLL